MFDLRGQPWSDNPNAPRITRTVYLWEKENLAGLLISAIFHGIVIVLFFQCIGALLNPVNRKKDGVKWLLVAHTVAMFFTATVSLATNLNVEFVSYINNRNYPGVKGQSPPGPLGYYFVPQLVPVEVVSNVTGQLNQWLADCLLLYRCWIIYDMNYWVIAFPFLMYLATWATGIMYNYYTFSFAGILTGGTLASTTGLSYYSIAFALNVTLTLMIVTRLVLHSRNIRNALGTQDSASGLYNVIAAMLVESCALYALSFLPYIGTWASGSTSQTIFYPILGEIQVIAPFLIVLRVANRTVLTSEAVTSGNVGTMRFNNQVDSAGSDGTGVLDQVSVAVTDAKGETPIEHGIEAEKTIEASPS